jgi:hypothetical protein
MDTNVYQSGCNCAGGNNKCECQDGYSCCVQKGNEGHFGLCVKNEFGCNTQTGLSSVKGKQGGSVEVRGNEENYRRGDYRQENYGSGDSCDNFKIGFFVMLGLFLVVLFLMIKKKK